MPGDYEIRQQEYLEELARREQEYKAELARRSQMDQRKNQIGETLKHALVQQGKKRLLQAGTAAAGEAAAAAGAAVLPWLLPVLGVITGIAAVIVLVIIILVSVCNASIFSGSLKDIALKAASWALPKSVCDSLAPLKGAAQYLDQAKPTPQ